MDKNDPHYYKIFEPEVGKRYCPIVTTNSGLYRYNMNDLVEAGKPYRNMPTIFMVQKINGIVSMTGEKLYEKQFTTAVENAVKQTGLGVEFYMGFADMENSCYQFYYEFGDTDVTQDRADEFNEIVDKLLEEYNIEYASKRHSLRLKHSEAHILPQYSYERFKRVLLDQGRRDGQFKLCHLMQNGLSAAEVLFVGDSEECDGECAERSGAGFFRIKTDEDMARLFDMINGGSI